jgi:hypothetical protein
MDEHNISDTSDISENNHLKVETHKETIPETLLLPSFQMLRKLVDDAYYLLNYSITAGNDIPEDISKAIIESKRIFERKEEENITPEMEVRFSTAYRKLALIMSPVTVESLRDTEDIQNDPNRPFLSWFRLSKARQVMVLLPLTAICLIFLILACEISHLLLTSGLRDFNTKEEEMLTVEADIEETQRQFSTFNRVEQQLATSSTKSGKPGANEGEGNPPSNLVGQDDQLENQKAQLENKLIQLEDRLTELDFEIKAIWDNLATLFHFTRILSAPGDLQERGERIRQKFIFVSRVYSITEVLNRLLPILYGALGATAYLLRTLIPHIRQRTFNEKLADSISVRICLGMLCGAAIQWFFTSKSQLQIFERSISSSALAFLAGYSVDLLFSIMDGLIQGFKKSKTLQKT